MVTIYDRVRFHEHYYPTTISSKAGVLECRRFVGGFSAPSKMPCWGYSIPADYCKVGSKLRAVKNSVCSKCYALKGQYVFPCVQNAMARRYARIMKATRNAGYREMFCFAFGVALNNSPYFRWHDSGDVQSYGHLDLICQIAAENLDTRFWLPTRETMLIRDFVRWRDFPSNLIVRVSVPRINQGDALTRALRILTGYTSTVSDRGCHTCPAPEQNGECGDCRACWMGDVSNVCYKQH